MRISALTGGTSLDSLTSPTGSLAVAISALLLVLGFRLARPSRAREWLAVAAYAGALASQTAAALGLLGPPSEPGPGLRVAGGVLLVAGVLLAGAPARARRRAAVGAAPGSRPRRIDPAYAGLALVLVGQLLRSPTRPAAAVSVAIAVLLAGWVALTTPRAT
ncbi:hypothetical protein [Anaeromyxobacter sp. Fw109-5]|uniref:hypothetical protein n=1 Tax=Anaeromyxobacter sp. (strain Fw109-5) TaxID=404589 RepID=UPI0000ED6CD5|nr:hypothetical protein [Anaeromyxobacter sp. Fw109-5]ABS28443.1 conserved hypothetical protein [Anaeromyxobacter sp. Fw109-5]